MCICDRRPHIEWHECQNKQWQIYGRTQIPRNRQSERCYVAVLVLVITMRKVVVQNGCTQANLQWKIRITNLSYDPHLLSLKAPLLAHYKSSSMTSRGRWRSPSEVSSSKARSSSRSCSRRSTVKSESGKLLWLLISCPWTLHQTSSDIAVIVIDYFRSNSKSHRSSTCRSYIVEMKIIENHCWWYADDV